MRFSALPANNSISVTSIGYQGGANEAEGLGCVACMDVLPKSLHAHALPGGHLNQGARQRRQRSPPMPFFPVQGGHSQGMVRCMRTTASPALVSGRREILRWPPPVSVSSSLLAQYQTVRPAIARLREKPTACDGDGPRSATPSFESR